MSLDDILKGIQEKFFWYDSLFIEGDVIIFEESYDMSSNERNDDDCFARALEIGEQIVDFYPLLEISNYYCHRYKYAIVELKLKVE